MSDEPDEMVAAVEQWLADNPPKPVDQFLTEKNEILRAEITRLQAKLAELQQTNAEQATIIIDYGQQLADARDNKDRLMIAAAASVKASMDEYKRGHADGVKSGREEGFEKAAGELERLDGFGEWWEAAQTIRAIKSPKPQEATMSECVGG